MAVQVNAQTTETNDPNVQKYSFKKERLIRKYLEIHASPLVPTGSLEEIASPGFGVGIRFIWNFNNHFALSAGWDYDRFGSKELIGGKKQSNKYSPFRFGPVLHFPVSEKVIPFVNAGGCFYVPLGNIREESFGYSGGAGLLIKRKYTYYSIAARFSEVSVNPKHRYFNLCFGIQFQVFDSRGVY